MKLEIDTWVRGFKCRGFPWIDGKTYYLNIQYFPPGASIYKFAWEKSVYITLNEQVETILREYLDSFVMYICNLKAKEKIIYITFEENDS
jgi:hypothetical protein